MTGQDMDHRVGAQTMEGAGVWMTGTVGATRRQTTGAAGMDNRHSGSDESRDGGSGHG